MKKIVKRTAVAVLAGTMAAGLLTGCGEKTLDGTKTVATVDGTEIPMGVFSMVARQQQAQTDAMYKSFMGSSANIWDQEVDEESGQTYGEQAVDNILEQVELMYIFKAKAGDYGVEVTDEDQSAISEAAAAFMAANTEETIKELAVTEDQVKTMLELQTYSNRMYDAIRAEAEVEITDEEAQQSSFSYVSFSISGDDLTEEDIENKKTQAQELLDKMKEDPSADMGETADSINEDLNALTGHFTTNLGEDEEYSSSYPDEVMEVLRTLKEGEMGPEVIETESHLYVVRLDEEFDQDSTDSQKKSLENTARNDYYSETTQKWIDEADIKVDEKVLKNFTITDKHTFVIQTPSPTPAPEAEEENTTEDTSDEADDAADDANDTAEDASNVADDANNAAEDASDTADDVSDATDDANDTADDASDATDDANDTADNGSDAADDASDAIEDTEKADE